MQPVPQGADSSRQFRRGLLTYWIATKVLGGLQRRHYVRDTFLAPDRAGCNNAGLSQGHAVDNIAQVAVETACCKNVFKRTPDPREAPDSLRGHEFGEGTRARWKAGFACLESTVPVKLYDRSPEQVRVDGQELPLLIR